MISVLMITREIKDPPYSDDEFVCVFTDPVALHGYVLTTPLEEGAAYSLLQCEANKPGVSRRIDLALQKIPDDERPDLAGSPVEVMVPVGQEITQLPPFAIEIFGSKEHRSLLRLFESPAGILEAQFDPKDLSEAAHQFVTELQKIQMRAFGIINGE